METGVSAVVLVHLDEVGARVGERPVPQAATVATIGDVLGFEKRGLSGRVELLAALDELGGDGLVAERDVVVDGRTAPATAYVLTEAGRERAREIRTSVEDRRVTVHADETVEIPLTDVDEYLPEPALPRALARTTDDGLLRVRSPDDRFVNRTDELDALDAVLDSVLDGDPTAVLVAGEAGVGKTTLVTEEFVPRAEAAGVRTVVEGFRTDAPEPYGPVRDALEALDVDETPLHGDGDEPEDSEAYAAERSAMFEAVVEALGTAAEDQAVAVVVEDLHLAGEPTVALLDALGEALAGRVVVLGTYRPEDLGVDHPLNALADDWDEGDATRHLSLPPFDRTNTRRLIAATVGASAVPESFARIVHEHTGGNPMFVEESVARTVAEGIAKPAYDLYPDERSQLPVPESVEAAVGLRLAAVEGTTESVLHVAGLIGQAVPVDVLVAALDSPRDAAVRGIDLLVDARVLERTDDDELRFVSGLVREACVEEIPADRERAYHARIGDAYEDAVPDDPDRHAAVARHRRAAGDYEAAVDAYQNAGEHALSVYAGETAAEAFETAHAICRDELGLPEDDELRLELLERVATTQELRDDFAAADRYLRYVAERTDDADRRRTVASRRARLWRERGDYRRALDAVEDALDDVGVEETRASANLVSFEAFLHGKRAAYDDANASYDRAIELAEAVGDEDLVARIRRGRAAIDLERGTVDEDTLAVFRNSLSAAREEDSDVNVGIATLNLGVALSEYGDYERAQSRLEDAIEQFQSVGVENYVCDARNTLGTVLASQCQWEEALAEYERVLETARRIDNERLETYAHINTAELQESRGRIEPARAAGKRALAAAEDLGNPQYRVETLLGLSRLAVAADDPGAAADRAATAIDAAESDGIEEDVPRAMARRADADRARDDHAAARDRYERALDRLASVGPAAAGASVALNAGLARAALATGDQERAREAASEALAAARDGAVPDERAGIVRALTVAGAVARDTGDHADAEDHLREAVEVARSDGRRLLAWRARCELALLERADGRESDAADRLRDVRDAAADGGVTRLVRKIDAALSAS